MALSTVHASIVLSIGHILFRWGTLKFLTPVKTAQRPRQVEMFKSIYSLPLAFFNISNTWASNLISEAMWTPRILADSPTWRGALEMVRDCSSHLFFKNETFIVAHFLGFSCMWFWSAPSSKWFKCSCSTEVCNRDLGSMSVRSLTYSR